VKQQDQSSLQQAREKFLHYLLFTTMLITAFYSIFDAYHRLYAGMVTDMLCLATTYISWNSIRKHGLQPWHLHFIMFGGILIFTPILFLESYENTGIYWMPVIPSIAFLIAGVRIGNLWVGIYFISILFTVYAGHQGWVQLFYEDYEIATMMLVTAFTSAIAFFFTRYIQQVNELFQQQHQKLEASLQYEARQSMAKSRFLSTMSHDLRTPVHSLIGIHSLLEKTSHTWTHEQQSYL